MSLDVACSLSLRVSVVFQGTPILPFYIIYIIYIYLIINKLQTKKETFSDMESFLLFN